MPSATDEKKKKKNMLIHENALRPSQLVKLLEFAIRGKAPLCIWGQPGIGKSMIVRDAAKKLGYGFIDVRAAYFDPVDLRGIPTAIKDPETGLLSTVWCRPSFLPKEGDGKFIILADELNRAPTLVQNAFFQMIQEKRCGEHIIPEDNYILAACNYETDGGGINRMPSALCNRFSHAHMTPHWEDFYEWGTETAEIHPLILAYHRSTEGLNLFEFDRDAKAWPSPRSWHQLSKLMDEFEKAFPPSQRAIDDRDSYKRNERQTIQKAAFSGVVGEGVAHEFINFIEDAYNLPEMQSIINDPKNAHIPAEQPSAMYAVCAMLARAATLQNMDQVLVYLTRISVECQMADYAVMCVKDAWKRDNSLASASTFGSFALKHKAFTSEFLGK